MSEGTTFGCQKWSGGTTFGCQNWSGVGPLLARGDQFWLPKVVRGHFWHDRTHLILVSGGKVMRLHYLTGQEQPRKYSPSGASK